MYAHVTATDEHLGEIEAETKYSYSSAGIDASSPLAKAEFVNTTLTSVTVEKVWKGADGTTFDGAVLDTSFQLVQQVNGYEPTVAQVADNSVTFPTGTAASEMAYTFDSLPTYDSAGNKIYYLVHETAPAGVSAITTTYDDQVTDEGERVITFTNTFDASDIATLSVKKEIQNRPWTAEDAYTFVLEPAGKGVYGADGTMTLDASASAKAAVPMPDSGIYNTTVRITDNSVGGYQRVNTFDDITYKISDLTLHPTTKDMTGDFYYTITEQLPVGITTTSLGVTKVDDTHYTYQGMTYDLKPHEVHVRVVANRLGEISTSVHYDEKETPISMKPLAINSYDASYPSAYSAPVVSVSKDISGREWIAGETFDFVLTPVNGAPLNVPTWNENIVSEGIASEADALDALDDDASKDYFTGQALVSRLTVPEDMDGKADTLTMAFENLAFSLSNLNRTTTSEQQAVDATALLYADGTKVPVNVRYDEFVYAIDEIAASSEDLSLDRVTEYVKITVIDRLDGTLDVSAAYMHNNDGVVTEGATAAPFTNVKNEDIRIQKRWVDEHGHDTASIAPVTVNLLRTTDVELGEGAEYYAYLDKVANAEVNALLRSTVDGKTIQWQTVPGAAHTFMAGTYGDDLTYVFEDMPQYDSEGRHYTYRLLENEPETDAYTVGDADHGIAAYTVDVPNDTLVVTNVSSYDPNGSAIINIVKSLSGRDWTTDDLFSFQLTALGSASYAANGTIALNRDLTTVPMPANGGATATVGKKTTDGHTPDRVTAFGTIEFTREDLQLVRGSWIGDFFYEMSESIVHENGHTYTRAEMAAMTVDELGALGITRTGAGTSASPYVYTYKGITFASEEQIVRIHVEDDGNGTIVTNIYYNMSEADMLTTSAVVLGGYTMPYSFVNTYTAQGHDQAQFVKHIEGREWREDDAFRVYIRQVGGSIVNPVNYGDLTDLNQGALLKDGSWVSAAVNFGSLVVDEATGDRAVCTGDGIYDISELHYVAAQYDDEGNLVPGTGVYSAHFVHEMTEVRMAINEDYPVVWDTIDDVLKYDTRTIYMKTQVTDNGDGTLVTEHTYWQNAACTIPAETTLIWVDSASGQPVAEGTAGAKQVEAPVFTNTYETCDFTVTKVWEGGLETTPPITVYLYADGVLADTVQFGQNSENYTHVWYDLPVYNADGSKIVYTVDEKPLVSYETTIEYPSAYEAVITNDFQSVTISGRKFWEHGDNPNATAAEAAGVTVQLYINGRASSMDTVTLTSETGWTFEFANLPKYNRHGEEIVYTVDELEVPGGYVKEVFDLGGAYGILNRFLGDEATIDLAVEKLWDDDNDSRQIRPASVTFDIYADGADIGRSVTVTAEGGWAATATGLPRYGMNGHTLSYQLVERAVVGYTTEISEHTVDEETGNVSFTVTNALDTSVVKVEGEKIWVDGKDAAGMRPDSVTFRLYRTPAGGEREYVGETVAEAPAYGDVWTYSFENLGGLPKYDEQGREYAYVVEEDPVEGYVSMRVNRYFVNTYTFVQPIKTVAINGVDATPEDGFALGDELTYTVSYTNTMDQPASVVITDTVPLGTEFVRAGEGGSYDSASGLVSFELGVLGAGETAEVSFVVRVTSVNGPIDNTARVVVNGVSYRTNSTTTYVQPEKTASVNGGADLAEGDQVSDGDVITYKVSYSNDGTTAADVTVTDQVPAGTELVAGSISQGGVYDEQTGVITWSFDNVAPGESGIVSFDVTVASHGQSVTNQADVTVGELTLHSNAVVNPGSETMTLSGQKYWYDADDAAGLRPASITVNLLANGEVVDSVEVTAADGWAWSFEGLPIYDGGNKQVAYTMEEAEVPAGYRVTSLSDGRVLVNSLSSASIAVSKAWDDNENALGTRPESVEVELLANGEPTGQVITLTADSDWAGVFEGLETLDAGGNAMYYSVRENNVPAGYTAAITGDAVGGFVITNSTNTDTTFLAVFKRWDDVNNRDGIRPESVTVQLLANGAPTGYSLELSEANSWSGYFAGLPVEVGGEQIVYSVSEDWVYGYGDPVYTYGSNVAVVTNVHESGTTTVDVTKVWDDNDDAMGLRGDVTLTLYGTAGGVTWDFGSQTIELDGKQTVTWEGVPTHINGVEVSYTVAEDALLGYVSTLESGTPEQIAAKAAAEAAGEEYVPEDDGILHFTVTNSLIEQTTYVHVVKVWNDADNQDGLRPESIDFVLLRKVGDGELEVADRQTVWPDENGNFEYLWDELPTVQVDEVVEGEGDEAVTTTVETPIVYTVTEAETVTDPAVDPATTVGGITGYVAHVSSAQPGEFVIVNTHNVETVSVSARKVWSDGDNVYWTRPGYVRLNLYANGVDTGLDLVLIESEGWAGTFDGLPKYADGTEIAYTLVEDTVAGYTGAVTGSVDEGFIVTNTYNETIDVVATKVWSGDEADPSTRGDVTLRLYKRVGSNSAVEVEGSERVISATATGDEASAWWTGLPSTEAGVKVTYVVAEDAVEGYESHVSEGVWSGTTLAFTVTNTYVGGGEPGPGPGPGPGPDETVLVAFIDYMEDEGSQVVKFKRVTVDEIETLLATQAGPEHVGFDFQGWDRNTVTDDEGDTLVAFVAQYQDTSTKAIVVSYVDAMMPKGEELVKTEQTTNPDLVEAPADPEHEGVTFTGWSQHTDAGGNLIYVARYDIEASGGSYVAVDPPVRKDVTGNPANMPEFGFVLTAVDVASPMPAGSTEGSKAVVLRGSGSVEFGTIIYTEAGEYTYRVYEVVEQREDWRYDGTEYVLKVVVSEAEDGTLDAVTSYALADGTPVDEAVAVFTNEYTGSDHPSGEPGGEPDQPGGEPGGEPGGASGGPTPGTGDSTDYGLVAVLAGLGIGLVAATFLVKKLRDRDDDA